MTIEELRDLIVREFMTEHGEIDISGLDFSMYDCDVQINLMKVKGNLWQCCNEVGGNLSQSGHRVTGTLYQNVSSAKEVIQIGNFSTFAD